ncbi:hypothetical protein MRX96_031674 [Rhipicephalus microplus]
MREYLGQWVPLDFLNIASALWLFFGQAWPLQTSSDDALSSDIVLGLRDQRTVIFGLLKPRELRQIVAPAGQERVLCEPDEIGMQ